MLVIGLVFGVLKDRHEVLSLLLCLGVMCLAFALALMLEYLYWLAAWLSG